jgi:putative transcriptional regulator
MRKDLFDQLVESVKQMKAIEAGRLKPGRVTRVEHLVQDSAPDVAALRARFKLSQAKFARLLGISVGTLQNWEQRRRRPEGPAKMLLRVAAAHPDALLSVSAKAPPRRTRRRKRAAI